MKRIIIVQETIPHYRIRFFEKLCNNASSALIYHSTRKTTDGLVETNAFTFSNKYISVKNFFNLKYQEIVKDFFLIFPNYLVLGLELKYFSNLLLWLLSLIAPVKVIWWTHGYNLHVAKQRNKFKIDRLIKTILMKKSHRILLYTNYNRQELINNGIKPHKIITLNNAIDERPYLKYFENISPVDIARINDRTKPSEHTISFIGRFTKAKKIEKILELALKLKDDFADLRIFLIGDGGQRSFLEKRTKSMGLEKCVYFWGTINDPQDLAPLMKLTDFIVYPGAVGLSIVHSFIYGIPFIAIKDEPHSPEIEYLQSDYNGYLASDIADMANWIKNTYMDHKKYQLLSEHCKLKIKNEVNLDNMVNNFCKIFE